MVRLSIRTVQSTSSTFAITTALIIEVTLILILLFSIACLAESPELTYMTPTDTPTSYPTSTPIPAQIIEIAVTPTPRPWLCLKGQIQISDKAGGQWIIGEKLLCAPEWKISNLYGPDFNSIGDKSIYFNDFIPEESIKEGGAER